MPSVVLVEPDPRQREALADALLGDGFHVEALDRARAALDRLLPAPADLLVIAARLPDGSGIEVVARLRTRHPDALPIVVTSPRASDRRDASACGATELLVAPVPADALLAAARRLAGPGERRGACEAPRDEHGLAFGRYRLGAVLGRGSYGVVYHAVDVVRGREVALKVLAPVDHEPDALARFVREVRALSLVDDPHVARFLDAAVVDGVAYCAMRPVHGPTLEQHVRAAGPLPEQAARGLLRGLLRAVAALDRVGAVHRDVTPRNVLLDGGRPERPVLIDLGLAKRADDPALTALDLVVGTPGYVAPEAVLGVRADPRADLFAVGLVALYALEGGPPFPGLSAEVLVELMASLPAPVPARLAPDLRALLTSLTAIEPAKRPATPEAALALLEATVASRP